MTTGFAHVGEWAASAEEGRSVLGTIRKVPNLASSARTWVDLSMAPGQPKAQYYASDPLAAAVLDGRKGIWHGEDQSPAEKSLASMCLMTGTSIIAAYSLLDYLMYYPYIDGSTLDEQVLDNTVTLPRYEDGDGVQVMVVSLVATNGGGGFTMNYTNQDGEAKTSQYNGALSGAAQAGTLVCSGGSVGRQFMFLAAGDTGVRSIESVTMFTEVGGLMAFVLVKPILQSAFRELGTATETELFTHRAKTPRILDGAYLNLATNVFGTVAGMTIAGFAETYWTEG